MQIVPRPSFVVSAIFTEVGWNEIIQPDAHLTMQHTMYIYRYHTLCNNTGASIAVSTGCAIYCTATYIVWGMTRGSYPVSLFPFLLHSQSLLQFVKTVPLQGNKKQTIVVAVATEVTVTTVFTAQQDKSTHTHCASLGILHKHKLQ